MDDEVIKIEGQNAVQGKNPTNPKLVARIIELRNEGDVWEEITKKINNEFNEDYTRKTYEKWYNKELALGTLSNKRGAKFFTKYLDHMDDRFGEIVKTMDRLHNAANKLLDEFEAKSEDDMRAYIQFMKAAPIVIQIVREIKSQIEFLKEEQEKVKIEQKNFIYSPLQIVQEFRKQLVTHVKEGNIKVLKPKNLNLGDVINDDTMKGG